MSKERTPADAYAEHGRDIAALLEWVHSEIEEHGKDVEITWGHVGDIGHVKECLKNVLSAVSNASLEEIEQNLADLCR